MLSHTINNINRKAIHSPQQHPSRVISPQRAMGNTTHQIHTHTPIQSIHNSLPVTRTHSPHRNIQHIHELPRNNIHPSHFNTLPQQRATVSAISNISANESAKQANVARALQGGVTTFPSFGLVNRPVSDIQEHTIIDSIQSNNREDIIRHDPNIRIIGPKSALSQDSKESKVLAEQFKSNLEKVELLKSSQAKVQIPSIRLDQVSSREQSLNEYIIQLLAEASKTKTIITKLINDNEYLISENDRLFKMEEEYQLLRKALVPLQLQNNDLKEQLRIVLRQNQENRLSHEVNNNDFEEQAQIITSLQQQIHNLKLIIDNFSNPEEFDKIIHIKNIEIDQLTFENETLKIQNQDLSVKIKEMLAQLLKFGNERQVLIQESEGFRSAATQEIERLRMLVEGRQLNHSPYHLNVIHEASQRVEGRTFPNYDDDDTKVQISGGYEELVLGKTPSPAKIVSSTFEVEV